MSYGKCSAKIIAVLIAATSSNSFAKDNPFEFKPKQETQVIEKEVEVDTRVFSASQREQVISLLTQFLSDASVNTEDSLFQIGDGKKFMVIPDEDVLVGKVAGKYVVWDASRKKNIYHDISKVDDIVSESEFIEISNAQTKSMRKVGEDLLDGVKTVADSVLDKVPSAPKMNANIKLGRQAKIKN